MEVAALRSKVTFQKNETVTDKYGNHKNAWTDYYTCFATIGGEGLASSKEEQVAGTTVEYFSMTVSIRYCQKAAAIDSTHFRVMFMGEIYNRSPGSLFFLGTGQAFTADGGKTGVIIRPGILMIAVLVGHGLILLECHLGS